MSGDLHYPFAFREKVMILLLILAVVLVSSVVRMLTAPFRYGHRFRHPFQRYGSGFGYGYNPYQYGCRRHHRLLGGIVPILVLVALDRMFGRRF